MKKFLKWASLGLVLLVIAAVVLPIAFFYAPAGLQTGIVRTVAGTSLDGEFKLESIRIRPGGVQLQGLRLDLDGQVLALESATLDAGLPGLLSAVLRNRTLQIESLQAKDLYIQLQLEDTEPVETEPFSLPQIGVPELPYSIWIGKIEVDGRFELKEGPKARFEFELADFQTDGRATGRLDLVASLDADRVELKSAIDIEFARRNFESFSWSPNLVWLGGDGSRSEISGVSLRAEQSAESLMAGVWFGSGDQSANIQMQLPEDHPLMDELDLELDYELEGQVVLNAGYEGIEIPAFLIEAISPDGHRFSLESLQRFVWKLDGNGVPVFNWPQGDWITFTLDAFRVPHPEWDARVDGRVVISLEDDLIRLSTDQPIEVRPHFSLPLVQLHRLQLEFDATAGRDGMPKELRLYMDSEIDSMGGDPDPFTIRMNANLNPQADQSLRWDFALYERSAFEEPSLHVQAEGRMSPEQDLETQLEYRIVPERWLRRLELDAQPIQELSGHLDITAEMNDGIRTRFHLDSRALPDPVVWPEALHLTVHGSSRIQDELVSVEALQTQLHSGDSELLANIEVDGIELDLATVGENIPSISGRGQLTHALFKLLEPQLPGLAKNYRRLEIQFNAAMDSGELGLHLMPFDEASAAVDLRAKLEYQYFEDAGEPGSEKLRAKAQIQIQMNEDPIEATLSYKLGERRDRIENFVSWIELDSLIALQESVLPADAQPTSAPTEPDVGDEPIEMLAGAFWQAWILTEAEELEILTRLEGVRSSGQVIVDNFESQIVITPDRFVLEPTQFRLVEAPTHLEGSIRYEAEQSDVYRAHFEFSSEGLDTAKLARAAQARSDRYLETKLNLNGSFVSEAESLADLFWQGEASFALDSGSGIIRLINPDQPSPAQDIAGAVGRLVLGRISPQLAVIPDIYDQLNNLNFDSLTLRASSSPGGNISFDRIELNSPQLRMAGGGQIRLDPDKGFQIMQQPLNLNFQLGAKGRLGDLFNTIGILRGTADGDGFRALNRDIQVGGTLAQPDMSDLWNMVLRR
ncbi:MAG: hypothetical protein JJU20_00180 [Opitutales bacterium]|nr:hypothetical protein [Opitutales bacterium]